MEALKIKKLRENAKVPNRATGGSAGLDLCACIDEPITLEGGETAVIPTGIAIALPSAEYGAFVFPRSGIAVKHGIGLLNSVGVVDSDYRGEVMVGVINQISIPYTIQPGERVAQMVIMPVSMMPTEEVSELDETERGAGGFGSTGKK
ncbi:MAG: dUTP diphosphatase [Clostridia bacterium]|nr:dUTP diphosphatase [Clostridia bacterium]MBO5066761.1 dUTP diphosphatase [Clostridia bacterium]